MGMLNIESLKIKYYDVISLNNHDITSAAKIWSNILLQRKSAEMQLVISYSARLENDESSVELREIVIGSY